jgi:phosphoglycerate dehydrogenase-like enzyme
MTGAAMNEHVIGFLGVMTPARQEAVRALLLPGFRVVFPDSPAKADMIAVLKDADFAITGQVHVDADMLAAAPRLKVLHKWGVGVDGLDLEAARKQGVRVCRTTGGNAKAVAEFTLGLMLGAMRAIAHTHERLKAGEWVGPSRMVWPLYELSGKTVGIVGCGAIGQEVARLVSVFGCRLLYTQRNRLPAETEVALSLAFLPLDALLVESDVVSLHVPLTPETHGLIDARAFGLMKHSATLINVARGGVVDEAALLAALAEGRLHAAAMDVFEQEPLPHDSPLIKAERLLLTPHLAAATADGFAPGLTRMFETFRLCRDGLTLPEGDVVV